MESSHSRPYLRAKPNLCTPDVTIKYISRYLGRPVIATSRIDKYDGDNVTFHYTRHEDNKTIEERVPALDFIKRLIVHIPEKHFKMLRYYGIYAKHHKQEKKLRKCISPEKRNKTLSKNRVSSAFHTLLLDIYEQDSPIAPSDLSGQIAKYLQHRVRETLTGEEIAQQFHLTYKHLTRTFSGVYGVGIMQYHIQLKMQVAARELRSSDKSISHIAMDLGFSDPLYFSKCFRKQFGISPRNYRHNQVLEVFSN